jgi:cytochrome c peroxidase
MQKKIIAIFLICFIYSCINKETISLEEKLHLTVTEKIEVLCTDINKLCVQNDKNALVNEFKKIRTEYKKIESFIEYYFQGLSRRINGPALPEIKTDDNIVNDASGLQVIEEILFDEKLDTTELKKQAKILITDLNFIKQNFKDLPIQNHHFYELIQHEIIRIAVLGITGFDSPVAFNSINEAHASLEGIEEFYSLYVQINNQKVNTSLINAIHKANKYINDHNNFDNFDRLVFIKHYLMPISTQLELEFKEVIKNNPLANTPKVFNGTLSDLMQGKRLNADAFSPYEESKSTPEKSKLGGYLFNNTELSRSNKVSCATCHDKNLSFTDGKKVSSLNIHKNSVNRNSPTLYYSAFQKFFFYDMRSQDLENQIESVMQNPDEFNLSPEEIKNKLQTKKEIVALFKKAYPKSKEITSYEIRNSIASYVRSLMPFKAKVDNFFNDKDTLTISEKNGFNLFAGKAKCATCHFIPLYNGTAPPWFNNSESEVIGVPEKINWEHAVVDKDLGRYKFNQLEQLKYSFKTPSIRNSEKTAPYMHNGVFNTLEDVIKFYELGGGNGIGMQLEYQTLPFDNLKLTKEEKRDLINFLNTLTDKDTEY